MKYRCSFRKDKRTGLATLVVEAADPYSAAVSAAKRRHEDDFDAVEVWDGPRQVLTWIRPPDDRAKGD
jgi:hypothetical protein